MIQNKNKPILKERTLAKTKGQCERIGLVSARKLFLKTNEQQQQQQPPAMTS